jgi:transcriptional regulator with XRE-family HTH domain
VSQFRPSFSLDLQVAIGARLRELRLAAGLSQQTVAERAGSHRPIIARMERGAHVPNLEGAILIAEVCGGDWRDVTKVLDRVIAEHTPDGSPCYQRAFSRSARPASVSEKR